MKSMDLADVILQSFLRGCTGNIEFVGYNVARSIGIIAVYSGIVENHMEKNMQN